MQWRDSAKSKGEPDSRGVKSREACCKEREATRQSDTRLLPSVVANEPAGQSRQEEEDTAAGCVENLP